MKLIACVPVQSSFRILVLWFLQEARKHPAQSEARASLIIFTRLFAWGLWKSEQGLYGEGVEEERITWNS